MNAWQITAELLRTVLIMSITGSISAIFLFAIKPIIKNSIPKSMQYYLWILVLVAFLVPFSLFVSIPVNNPIKHIHEIVEDNVKTNDERYEEKSQEQFKVSFEELEVENQIKIMYEDKGWLNNSFLVRPLTISLIIFIDTVFRYLTFTWKIYRSRRIAKDNEIIMLKKLNKEKRSPRLYRSNIIPTPMLIGVFRPIIMLPDKEYSDAQLNNILLHELTHFKRQDVLVKWIAVVAKSLHWFNPLIYFVQREIDRIIELSCDEEVIKNFDKNDKQSYGKTLIDMVAEDKTSKSILSTTMCEEKKSLKERLGAIMKHKRFSFLAVVFSCILLIVTLCGIFIFGSKSINKVTTPVITFYEGNGIDLSNDDSQAENNTKIQLIADKETGVIRLSDLVEIQVTYRDNTGKSGVKLFYAALDYVGDKRLIAAASRDVFGASDIKNTSIWNVLEQYPEGFDGYVWAVVTDADNIEHNSEMFRVVYDPIGAKMVFKK